MSTTNRTVQSTSSGFGCGANLHIPVLPCVAEERQHLVERDLAGVVRVEHGEQLLAHLIRGSRLSYKGS